MPWPASSSSDLARRLPDPACAMVSSGAIHSKEEWETWKKTITHLYLSEKRKLRDVREIMIQKHGFRATIHQYKIRLQQWGLEKNNKESDMRYMSAKAAQRAAQGKKSAFRVRGRDISQAELDRYWHRKHHGHQKGSSAGIGEDIDLSSMPEEIECYTPASSRPSSPTPPSLDPPQPPEAIYRDPAVVPNHSAGTPIDTPVYITTPPAALISPPRTELVSPTSVKPIKSRPESPPEILLLRQQQRRKPPNVKTEEESPESSPDNWRRKRKLTDLHPLTPPGHLLSVQTVVTGTRNFYVRFVHSQVDASDVVKQPPHWNLRRFYELALSVSAQLSLPQWNDQRDSIVTLYNDTLDQIRPIITPDPNPLLLTCIFQICCRFWQDGKAQALHYLLSYIRHEVGQIHGKSHPLYVICGSLLRSPEVLSDLVVTGLRWAVNGLAERLGEEHPQTLAAARGLYSAYYAQGDMVSAKRYMVAAVELEEKFHPQDIHGRLDLLFKVIHCELGMNDITSALENLKIVENTIDGLPGATDWRVRMCYLRAKGELLRQQGDPKAIDVLEEQLRLARESSPLQTGWWALVSAEKHLEFAKRSVRTQDRMVPYLVPC
ncbi:hypothetical protein GE21DRAFT_10591 [Neurospora crassa]|uniref:Clr5 domain-containing protein n=1 Tax=Neurospora crassa (strain ATCC 24698 / 74-OR23-1A / CBS 708.71 / DSM 1257 / FGSC 987) TaxID=367110 RepID=Q7S4B9_NEUCR|nr:hypothetical protein NCU08174 [Neurospora crassa OR74A]EAA30331.2 hypothetical protein NCU08174 [Neurospora crassa OR74A]KHE80446.1 hypothetical protein GE21DRAFT_10591 [Neurospora crassa]|eukprot:XP_959567.2 hypothetical protein NCU08174 [Neurospora crassa OR74A]